MEECDFLHNAPQFCPHGLSVCIEDRQTIKRRNETFFLMMRLSFAPASYLFGLMLKLSFCACVFKMCLLFPDKEDEDEGKGRRKTWKM